MSLAGSREPHDLPRTVKEAFYIKGNDLSPNKNIQNTNFNTYEMRPSSKPQTSNVSSSKASQLYHFGAIYLLGAHSPFKSLVLFGMVLTQ